MKKIVMLVCLLTALGFPGTTYASGAAQGDSAPMDPLLRLLVRNGVITEEQARQVEAEYRREKSAAVTPAGRSAAAPAETAQAAPQAAASTTPQPAVQKVEIPAPLRGFKPIGLFYISYQNGERYAGVPGETSNYNGFLLKRGYFGADVDITPYLTGRFVTDVTVDSTGDVKPRAKYIYGKFHGKGNNFFTGPYMEFGLAHMPWLDFEEAINGFRMQDTMFLERNGAFNSADTGVLFGSDLGGTLGAEYKSNVNSHYAGRYGSWQAGFYNGGGYHAAEKNDNKAFEGRISIRPIPDVVPGLQFTAFGIAGRGNQAESNGLEPPKWRSFAGMVSYESRFFTGTAQGYVGTGNQSGTALAPNGTAAHQRGFSLFGAAHIPTPHFGQKVSILGRFANFDSDTDIYSDVQRRYIAGIAWHMYKGNIWLFDYQRTNHSLSAIPAEDRLQITLQTAF
jgi:hypothetical protein